MPDTKKNFEYGDFMVQLDKHYLGSGECALGMTLASREIRRDACQLLYDRKLKSIRWSITVDLKSCSAFWDWLTSGGELTRKALENKLFTQGVVLELYPVDPRRRGFCFERVLLDEVCEASGKELQHGSCRLKFTGEAAAGSVNKYFTRMGAGARPGAVLSKAIPSAQAVLQYLAKYSAGILNVVCGQTLLTDGFAPGQRGSYCLELASCQNWQLNGAHCFAYRLTGRFPAAEKESAAQKIFELACSLHGCTLPLSSDVDLLGKVEKLDCNLRKTVDGRSVVENRLDFTITVD